MRWLAPLVLASSVACSDSSPPNRPTPAPVTPSLVSFAGTISESETNTPVAGITVCFHVQNCALTGPDGSYQFTVDPTSLPFAIGPGTRLCPHAWSDSFEGRAACVSVVSGRVSWSTTLQRTITVEAGRSVSSTIFKGEGSGGADDLCEPCKTLRVNVPGRGTLVVRLLPELVGSGLLLGVPYTGFGPEDRSVTITTERVILMYVKAGAVLPATFELSTAFVPE
jgi:hypothetical protein